MTEHFRCPARPDRSAEKRSTIVRTAALNSAMIASTSCGSISGQSPVIPHDGTGAACAALVVAVQHVVFAAAVDRVAEPLDVRASGSLHRSLRSRARCDRRSFACASRFSRSPIIGVPQIGRITLLRKRVEPMRAWTMATVFNSAARRDGFIRFRSSLISATRSCLAGHVDGAEDFLRLGKAVHANDDSRDLGGDSTTPAGLNGAGLARFLQPLVPAAPKAVANAEPRRPRRGRHQ